MSHHPALSTRYVSLATGLLAAHPAAAQTTASGQPTFGSEITVTATGEETEVDEVPVATTVITRNEMDDAQAETVTDLLRRVPGLTVARSGDVGSQTSVFSRGTNSNHTLVLLDGVRLNSPTFGGYDWSLPTTTALERVEVARGPYSALWGSDAVGGVVNLISQRRAGGFGGRLLAEGGEDGWERFEATAGIAGSSFDLQASGYRRSTDGSTTNSDASSEQALVTAGFSWGHGSRLGLIYQDLESEIGIPFVSPGSPTPNRRQDTSQQLIAVPLRWSLSDRWRIETTASRVERDIDFADPDDPWGYVFSTSEADTDQLRVVSHHALGRHSISVGADWRDDSVTTTDPAGPSMDDVDEEALGFFVQDNWQINTAFRVLVGVRWEDTDSWGSETTGRLDVGWRVSDTVELRGGVGQAFRAPALGELYGSFGGNPDLQPESSTSAEVGVVYTPLDGKSRWQLNAFQTDIDDLIEYDFVTWQNINAGSAEITGAELVWEQGAFEVVRWFLQATWLDTEGDDGLPLLRRPEWSASWTLSGRFSENWSGDATVLWVDSRDDVDPITYEEHVENDGYTTVDLAVAWQPWDQLAITARATNIFDEDYQEVLGYPAPGRRFFAGLRWDF